MQTLKIPQATKKGYVEIEPWSVFDALYLNSKTRRGRVQGGGKICPAIQCTSELLVFEGYEEDTDSPH